MPSTAHVTVIGHLGADPKLTFLPSGTAKLEFRIAVSDGSQKEPHTTWYGATMLGKRAESWAEYGLSKGALVAVIGKLSMREWESKQGERRVAVDVLVDQVMRLERSAAVGDQPPF